MLLARAPSWGRCGDGRELDIRTWSWKLLVILNQLGGFDLYMRLVGLCWSMGLGNRLGWHVFGLFFGLFKTQGFKYRLSWRLFGNRLGWSLFGFGCCCR